MTVETRIKQLEKTNGVGSVKGYMCVFFDPPGAEEMSKGYKVQPFIKESGGTGEDPFYLATRAELDAFAARDDVDLTTIKIVYKDSEPISTITNGDYKTAVGIDVGKL